MSTEGCGQGQVTEARRETCLAAVFVEARYVTPFEVWLTVLTSLATGHIVFSVVALSPE